MPRNENRLTSVASTDPAIAHPEPTRAMRAPLTTGPTRPPKWKIEPFTLTAEPSRSGTTIWLRVATRAGVSMAPAVPATAATRYTCQSSAAPSRTSRARVPIPSATTLCVTSTIDRRGNRSAITPACTPSRRVGPNWNATARPTSPRLPVSSSTSQSMATREIQVERLQLNTESS